MRTMTMTEFSAWAADNIKDHLPDEYRDAEIRIDRFKKLGSSYTAMCVIPEGLRAAPAVDMDWFYQAYRAGEDRGAILGEMARVLQYRHPMEDFDWLFDYDKVRGKLFVRLSSPRQTEGIFERVPHRFISDLAVTYHIFTDEHDGGFGSTMVTNDMLEAYGISAEQLHSDALESSSAVMPAELIPLHEMLADLESAGPGNVHPGRPPMVLTNKRRCCGASVLLYPGMMEMIADAAGGSYYVLPSSVDELIIVPDEGNLSLRRLETTVRSINRSIVEEKDFLSDNVYYYDAGAGSFGFAPEKDCQ